MYNLSYCQYAELFGVNQVVDRVRQQALPKEGLKLDYLDEVFTSEN
jgi:dolichyl-diphosphooligosaccharide--protein glycosyltransferase